MRATAGATDTNSPQLAPKEIGGCRASGWSGLGLVGRHSRTKHGQLTRRSSCLPPAPRGRSTSGPPDGVLAKDSFARPAIRSRRRPPVRREGMRDVPRGQRCGWHRRAGPQKNGAPPPPLRRRRQDVEPRPSDGSAHHGPPGQPSVPQCRRIERSDRISRHPRCGRPGSVSGESLAIGEPGDRQRGERVVAEKGCLQCHALAGGDVTGKAGEASTGGPASTRPGSRSRPSGTMPSSWTLTPGGRIAPGRS